MKKYFPTELILQIYNALIAFFILGFHSRIEDSTVYLIFHLIFALLIHFLNYLKQTRENIVLNFFLILMPVLMFSFYHYESGMINLIIFPEYLDSIIKRWDLVLFGKHYHEIWAAVVNSNFIDQVIHFFYFSYYVILVIPAFLLVLKERKKAKTWQSFKLTRQLIFSITFTMLTCYIIFIVFPVKGPTEYHSVLFPEPNGMVSIMDFLYANGDSDGGAIPSSHVAVSCVIMIFVFRYLKDIRWYLLVFFVFLAIGTVYCSYHYLIDVFAGILMGILYYGMSEKLFLWMNNNRQAKGL